MTQGHLLSLMVIVLKLVVLVLSSLLKDVIMLTSNLHQLMIASRMLSLTVQLKKPGRHSQRKLVTPLTVSLVLTGQILNVFQLLLNVVFYCSMILLIPIANQP